ncbi:cation diffusion facilitator family transporter [Geobacter sp. AOG2]|uniref:cation diffusion facilitator family transporter n=1 Tax=Geobacter sp. AOG2 TaxID=1566347 RepID=UPI001CC6613A|nr:cation diffusion facilitator family transporter [Geobacter sp. AOG2]GFE62540.1 cation transporter [Geobacter sp. AOG2]
MTPHNPDKSIATRFRYAIVLTLVTLVAEVVGGIWTNSLALLSDAAHVFLDLFALLLSLGAIKLAGLPSSETRTFGWHRAEVFASFINGVSIFLIAFGILYEAAGRLLHPEPVNSLPMFVIAVIGLIMNLIAASALHQHSHDDLNVHSAFLHVIGDAAASVGVIVGGVVMYVSHWYVLDALISIGIGCVVFFGAWRVLRESTHILLEGVPRGLQVSEIAGSIRSVPGVQDIHHLNVWSICSHIVALSAHLDVRDDFKWQQADVIHEVEHMLLDRYHITHTTLQVECSACQTRPIIKDLNHATHHHHGHAH